MINSRADWICIQHHLSTEGERCVANSREEGGGGESEGERERSSEKEREREREEREREIKRERAIWRDAFRTLQTETKKRHPQVVKMTPTCSRGGRVTTLSTQVS